MYKRDKKQMTLRSQLLLLLLDGVTLYSKLASMGSIQRAMFPEYHAIRDKRRYTKTISDLKRSGRIRYEYVEAKRIIKLTSKGELEALFTASKLPAINTKWDNKWRLILFDIPEDARNIRDKIRTLLKQFGYKPLQASVYISPYPINPEGINYLKKSNLNNYIRILRVDKVDNDSDLRKTFKI